MLPDDGLGNKQIVEDTVHLKAANRDPISDVYMESFNSVDRFNSLFATVRPAVTNRGELEHMYVDILAIAALNAFALFASH